MVLKNYRLEKRQLALNKQHQNDCKRFEHATVLSKYAKSFIELKCSLRKILKIRKMQNLQMLKVGFAKFQEITKERAL